MSFFNTQCDRFYDLMFYYLYGYIPTVTDLTIPCFNISKANVLSPDLLREIQFILY